MGYSFLIVVRYVIADVAKGTNSSVELIVVDIDDGVVPIVGIFREMVSSRNGYKRDDPMPILVDAPIGVVIAINYRIVAPIVRLFHGLFEPS